MCKLGVWCRRLPTAMLAGALLVSQAGASGGEGGPSAAPSDAIGSAARTLASEIAKGHHPGIGSFHLSVGGKSVVAYSDAELGNKPPDLRSATKSITALLVGIALEQGHIPSLGSKVSELLGDHRSTLQQDGRKASITVEDLLTMRSGLDCDDWTPGSPGHEDTMYEQVDWLSFWARVPARRAPGEQFSYCTGNVMALGAIIESTTGKPLNEFADAVLFAPLGINDARWAVFNRGRGIDAGGHLHLQPADLARIGELVLNQGQWGGRRIVSADWIRRMTTAHTSIPERKQRYGYLWWIDETSPASPVRTRLFLAWGNGGNFLVVMPELSAVATFTGTRFNRPEALQPLHWLRDRILPAFATVPGAR